MGEQFCPGNVLGEKAVKVCAQTKLFLVKLIARLSFPRFPFSLRPLFTHATLGIVLHVEGRACIVTVIGARLCSVLGVTQVHTSGISTVR